MFLEFWKRRQIEIAYNWDLLGFEDEEVCKWTQKDNNVCKWTKEDIDVSKCVGKINLDV